MNPENKSLLSKTAANCSEVRTSCKEVLENKSHPEDIHNEARNIFEESNALLARTKALIKRITEGASGMRAGNTTEMASGAPAIPAETETTTHTEYSHPIVVDTTTSMDARPAVSMPAILPEPVILPETVVLPEPVTPAAPLHYAAYANTPVPQGQFHAEAWNHRRTLEDRFESLLLQGHMCVRMTEDESDLIYCGQSVCTGSN